MMKNKSPKGAPVSINTNRVETNNKINDSVKSKADNLTKENSQVKHSKKNKNLSIKTDNFQTDKKGKVSYLSLIGLGLGIVSVGYYMLTKKSVKPLEVVKSVDLNRYSGKWYEIAVIPYIFERDCTNTTAEYTVTDEGYVKVVNSCVKDIIEEEVESVQGKAFPVKGANNAKLKVQFFWPLKGDYWIIDLDKDYQYAVVGNPNRKNLWILSRTSEMDNSLYQELLKKAEAKGFDISKLRKTEHYRSLKKPAAVR